MKLPRLDISTSLGPAAERMHSASRASRPQPLGPRERNVEIVAGVLVVAASVLLHFAFDSPHKFALGTTLMLTAAYALALRVRFSVGVGFTTPAELLLVPMLFVLPAPLVPVVVEVANVLSRLPEILTRRLHPDRLLVAPADGWYAVGPALVFAAAGLDRPDWGDAHWYLLAFAAQLTVDLGTSTVRVWFATGVTPNLHLRVMARVYMVDAILWPIGFFVAYGAVGDSARVLLALPLVGLFGIFAQEREAHIESALQLSNAYRGTALLLGDVLEDKDAYTASHSHGVVSLSLAVADRMRLDPAARRRVEFGALLHDIGKIAVPAEIINKPGPLDDNEWAVMKLHTVEGQQMLDRVGGVLGEVGRVVRSSHEHFDGSGYPDGLRGHDIPIEARVVACCDAFSAMTTTRSYRKAMSLEAAREELLRNSGTQFDPKVVEALLAVIGDRHVIFMPPALDETPPAAAHSTT
jgi:HD-GYP domain-containing protein (c-di-GMP phosphodiesterase class II)